LILPGKRCWITNELRNNTYFETVKHKDFQRFRSVDHWPGIHLISVSLTIQSKTVNKVQKRIATIGIGTTTYFQHVFNNSSQLMLFTRWHEDDLAGRLFNPKSEFYNKWRGGRTQHLFPIVERSKIANCGILWIRRSKTDWRRVVGIEAFSKKHLKQKGSVQQLCVPWTTKTVPASGNKIKKEWFNVIKEFNCIQSVQ
jgi:hypothetical protein